MPTVTNGEEQEAEVRLLGYSFGLLLLGLVGILLGVVVVERVPATLGGALIAAGYLLVYAGFLASLYLDLRGGETTRTDRPLDGESG